MRYGLLGSLKLIKNLILTRIFFKGARLIKFPIDIRNRHNIIFGLGLSTGVGCRIEAYPLVKGTKALKIGNNLRVNDYLHITATGGVTIGDNVLIASRVFITDVFHGSYSCDENDDSPLIVPNDRKLCSKPVVIGSNCWIGEGVCILPGVIIGEGCIIGANSVVTKSINSYSIAVGVPAKVIKVFDFDKSRWVQV